MSRRMSLNLNAAEAEVQKVDDDQMVPNAKDFPLSPRVQPGPVLEQEGSDLILCSSNNNVYDFVD